MRIQYFIKRVNVCIRKKKERKEFELNLVRTIAAGEDGNKSELNKRKAVRVLEEAKEDVCSFLLVL